MKAKEELSNFSLQLLTMPDFMRSLKIGGSDVGNRSAFLGYKERYGNKTLVGNWQERRVTVQPVNIKSSSTYREDFMPLDHDEARDLKITNFNKCDDQWFLNQGMPFQDLIRQGPPEEYQQNMSSLYDLTYGRTCPELYRKRHKKIVKKLTSPKPENDYMLDYGNLSDHGFRTYKLMEWKKQDEEFERSLVSTMYKDDFITMPLEKIEKRRSPYKQCSSSFNKILLDNKDLNTRGFPYRFVSEDCRLPIPTDRKPIPIVPELE